MTTEAHMAAGWILAHLGGRETRRFRALVTFAAVAPDLDAISYVFGTNAYANTHHALGHNIFFSLLLSGLCAWLFRARGRRGMVKMLLFSQLAFYSHYFGDYFFSGFPLVYYWPVSDRDFIYSFKFTLGHPINLAFSYASLVIVIAMTPLVGRTPIELVWPELDRRLINLLRRRDLACHICGRRANERCTTCGQPCCLRHASLDRHARIHCTTHAGRAIVKV